MIATIENIRKVRPIADNINDAKRIEVYIEEVENLFVIPAIGYKLYKDIDENRSSYDDILFEGGGYNDDNKMLAGLYSAIGYLAYSRFVRNQNVNITAFGIVQKNSTLSDPVDEKTLVRISNDAEKIGIEYLNQCVEYLSFIGRIDQKTVKRISKIKAIG